MPTVNFDLKKLPDRVLSLMVRGSEEGNRLDASLARVVHDALVAELARRNTHNDGEAEKERIEIVLPSFSPSEAMEAYRNLRADVMHLETAAALAQDPEARELRQAAEFLFQVSEACLPPRKSGESSFVQ